MPSARPRGRCGRAVGAGGQPARRAAEEAAHRAEAGGAGHEDRSRRREARRGFRRLRRPPRSRGRAGSPCRERAASGRSRTAFRCRWRCRNGGFRRRCRRAGSVQSQGPDLDPFRFCQHDGGGFDVSLLRRPRLIPTGLMSVWSYRRMCQQDWTLASARLSRGDDSGEKGRCVAISAASREARRGEQPGDLGGAADPAGLHRHGVEGKVGVGEAAGRAPPDIGSATTTRPPGGRAAATRASRAATRPSG